MASTTHQVKPGSIYLTCAVQGRLTPNQISSFAKQSSYFYNTSSKALDQTEASLRLQWVIHLIMGIVEHVKFITLSPAEKKVDSEILQAIKKAVEICPWKGEVLPSSLRGELSPFDISKLLQKLEEITGDHFLKVEEADQFLKPLLCATFSLTTQGNVLEKKSFQDLEADFVKITKEEELQQTTPWLQEAYDWTKAKLGQLLTSTQKESQPGIEPPPLSDDEDFFSDAEQV